MVMQRLERSLVIANGKGGVGKTTLTANLAVEASKRWERVIAVDLDPQANLAADLGVEAHDNGRSLAGAALGFLDAATLHDTGRNNVFYVAGGDELNTFERGINHEGNPEVVADALRQALKPHIDGRTWFMIDTPPAAGNILSDAAIALGEWLLIPTREDARSRAGVGTILDRVIKVSESVGSSIRPVGVALFGLDPRATKLNARARSELESGLGGAFPVLDATIRDAKKAQIDAKEVGVTAAEYAELARTTDVIPWYEAAKKGVSRLTFASNADTLAGDYERLAGEVATIIAGGA